MIASMLGVLWAMQPIKTSVVRTDKGFELRRDGQPYFVKGGGGDMSEPMLTRLKACGGNSLRTWDSDNKGPTLDLAQKLGLTVTVGIWLGHKEHGFNWDDATAVRQQFERARAAIREYRNHPALLAWSLGNEMEGGNDNATLWRAINDMAKMVKQEDPNHPVMTIVADMSPEKAANIMRYAPDLDLVGINSYGGLTSLPKRLETYNFSLPFMVTEFGPGGPWESPKTAFGTAVEMTSTAKADHYRKNYLGSIAGSVGRCLGSYAFDWGQKQEETPTWFGLFLQTGEKTQAVDELSKLWSGAYPANRAPILDDIQLLGGDEVRSQAPIAAVAKATDPEGDALDYRWEIRSTDQERRKDGQGEATPEAVIGGVGRTLKVAAPKVPGRYRLYLIVRDGKGGAAVANIPFRVGPAPQ